MLRVTLTRLGSGLLMVLVTSTLVFAAVHALPGDAATLALGQDATPSDVTALRRELGLDHSMVSQYWRWLSGLPTGNLGESAVNRVPVTEIIGPRLAKSGILLGVTVLILIPASILLGTLAGLRAGRPIDIGIQVVSLVGFALPEFVVGVVLILVFAVSVHLLPAVSLNASPSALVLPCLTLVVISVGYCARMVRAGVIEVLDSEYVHMARIKGMPESLVIRRHVLPNALVPSLHVFALAIAWMTGGLVIVENLFSYPGVGQALVGAVQSRDILTVEALVLFVAVVYVAVNLLADILTIMLTPRLRTG